MPRVDEWVKWSSRDGLVVPPRAANNSRTSIHSYIHTFIQLFIHSFMIFAIRPFFHSVQSIHACKHAIIHPSINSFIHSFIHSFVQSFIHSLFNHSVIQFCVHSSIHSFNHPFLHSFILHSINPSFIHSFIQSSTSIHPSIPRAGLPHTVHNKDPAERQTNK